MTARYEGESAQPVADRREFVPEGGRVELSGMRPGPWSLSATAMSFGPSSDGDARSESVRVEAVAGELREARVRLP